jgi:hypothetical protein
MVHALVWTGPSVPGDAFEADSAVTTALNRYPDRARLLAMPNNLPILLDRWATPIYTGTALRRASVLEPYLDSLCYTPSPGEGPLALARLTGTGHVLRQYPTQNDVLGPPLPVRDPWLQQVFNWPETVYLYRVSGVMPRARMVERYEVVPRSIHAAARLCDPGFDVADSVILEAAPPPLAREPAASKPLSGPAGDASRAVWITTDEARRVVIEVGDGRAGLLVLADTFYPGWEARVDGRPVPILCANVAFRAVPVGPGSHRVEFTYHPRMFALGWRISVGALAAWLFVGAAVFSARRARRRRCATAGLVPPCGNCGTAGQDRPWHPSNDR